MASSLESLNQWVEDVARLTEPAEIHWCNGSSGENRLLTEKMLGSKARIAEITPMAAPGIEAEDGHQRV